MKLPTEIFGATTVVHSPEELGVDQAREFIDFVLEVEPRQVVLDMDSAESIDSEGLSALLECQDRLRELHGDLKIATNNSVNRKLLEITRIDEQLEVFASVIDAVNSFR